MSIALVEAVKPMLFPHLVSAHVSHLCLLSSLFSPLSALSISDPVILVEILMCSLIMLLFLFFLFNPDSALFLASSLIIILAFGFILKWTSQTCHPQASLGVMHDGLPPFLHLTVEINWCLPCTKTRTNLISETKTGTSLEKEPIRSLSHCGGR